METIEQNETIKTILSRRSVRDFTGEKVGKETLTLLLRAAMAAPSAVNVQPWAFIAVTDETVLSRLEERLPYAKMLRAAGSAIIVCGIPKKDKTFAKLHWEQDCSASAENILLAAHSLGLGAVWTAVYPDAERVRAVREICSVPKGAEPLAVIPIGVPKAAGNGPKDKFKAENIHWDRWEE